MSAQSGIKVPPAISDAFSAAQRDGESVRALVFTIEGESFQHLTSVSPKGTYQEDITLLTEALPNVKTPASFAYRLDSKSAGSYEWMMVTFVPDNAGVRAKMLQASSRAGLMKALGANNFKHDWFATSLDDLTPRAFKQHLNHLNAPPPLTASEAALAEIKAAEAEEARRSALDTETAAARRKAVIGLGGKTEWQNGVHDALNKASQRSDDGWLVTLEIDAKNTAAVNLLRSEACKPNEVSSRLPEKSPCYVFYSYPTPPPPKPAKPVQSSSPAVARNMFQATAGGARPVVASNAPRMDEEDETEGEEKEKAEKKDEPVKDDAAAEEGETTEKPAEDETPDVSKLNISAEPEESSSPIAREPSPPVPVKGRVLFVYWCPQGSPVRFRMVYSTTVRGIQQDAMDKAGIEIAGKIETGDKSDLGERQLKEAVPTRPSAPGRATSLPTPAPRMFGAPAPAGRFGSPAFGAPSAGSSPKISASTPASLPVFGAPAPAGFGRPKPARNSSQTPSISSTASAPAATPAGDDEDVDSKERIANAFNAFGPRVQGGGGFARPRPAGRR